MTNAIAWRDRPRTDESDDTRCEESAAGRTLRSAAKAATCMAASTSMHDGQRAQIDAMRSPITRWHTTGRGRSLRRLVGDAVKLPVTPDEALARGLVLGGYSAQFPIGAVKKGPSLRSSVGRTAANMLAVGNERNMTAAALRNPEGSRDLSTPDRLVARDSASNGGQDRALRAREDSSLVCSSRGSIGSITLPSLYTTAGSCTAPDRVSGAIRQRARPGGLRRNGYGFTTRSAINTQAGCGGWTRCCWGSGDKQGEERVRVEEGSRQIRRTCIAPTKVATSGRWQKATTTMSRAQELQVPGNRERDGCK